MNKCEPYQNVEVVVACVVCILALGLNAVEVARQAQAKTVILLVSATPDLTGTSNFDSHLQNHSIQIPSEKAWVSSIGFEPSETILGFAQLSHPSNACSELDPVVQRSGQSWIALISGGNCSLLTKVSHAETAGFKAVIVYGNSTDMSLHDTDNSVTSPPISIPAYFVTTISWLQQNITRPPLLAILTHSTSSSSVSPTQPTGTADGSGPTQEDSDSFGEHYFHICIYIWACVVVSSLIALSVKWGCCGRSLTRWEVKRIPLKRFHRSAGDDGQDKCPICHEDFHEGRFIRQLPCNHCYHSYCVDRWLVKMSNRCPLCKQRVSISLFCPWTKRQRKKEMHSNITSEAETEPPPDEHPPLPPLSTLTPSNWYGEAIMSAPSKFILMRPGKPTRVIDLRETHGGGDAANQETELQITPEGDTSENSSDSRESVRGDDDPVILTSSSRSCSVSSDQPLLFEMVAGGDTDTGLSHKTKATDVVTDCDCCQDSHLASADNVHVSNEESNLMCRSDNSKDLRKADRRKVDMTVSIASASSNVVTCTLTSQSSIRADNQPDSHSNSPHRDHVTRQAWSVVEVEDHNDKDRRTSKAFSLRS